MTWEKLQKEIIEAQSGKKMLDPKMFRTSCDFKVAIVPQVSI